MQIIKQGNLCLRILGGIMQKGLIISNNIEKYREKIKNKLSSKYLLHFSNDINLLSNAIISGNVMFIAFDPNTLYINFIDLFHKIKAFYEKIPVFLISDFTISDKILPVIERFISYKINEVVYLNKDIDSFIETLNNLPEQEENKNIHLLYNSLIGESENTENLRFFISSVARNENSVLLLGETGCGKTTVAGLIHDLSNRKDKKFISLDIGTIPSQLIESVLFGAKKGSYTDACENMKGIIEEANNGTLFLDEIENMSLEIQMKLLRVLETHKIRAIGENTEKYIDFRLICASNCNLKEMIAKGLFREDLYYRINIANFEIQPLRERKVDISNLSRFYAKKYNFTISDEAISKLETGNFKGNIRELFYIIERAFIKASPLQTIYPEHIIFEL